MPRASGSIRFPAHHLLVKARECERLLAAAIGRERGSRAVVLIEETGKRAAPAPIFREADSAPSIAPLDLARPWI